MQTIKSQIKSVSTSYTIFSFRFSLIRDGAQLQVVWDSNTYYQKVIYSYTGLSLIHIQNSIAKIRPASSLKPKNAVTSVYYNFKLKLTDLSQWLSCRRLVGGPSIAPVLCDLSYVTIRSQEQQLLLFAWPCPQLVGAVWGRNCKVSHEFSIAT